MAKSGSRSRYEIVRSKIKRDLLFFGLPAFVVFFAGLVVCARDGLYDGITSTLWNAIRHRNLGLLSLAEISGVLLYVVGLAIMLVGQGTLKRSYSGSLVIRRDHQLVSHGIYRFVRHPIYLGLIIVVCIGVPLFARSLYGFLILSALIPLIHIRIHIEEAMLTEEFRDAYATYQKGTSKLIPFIY